MTNICQSIIEATACFTCYADALFICIGIDSSNTLIVILTDFTTWKLPQLTDLIQLDTLVSGNQLKILLASLNTLKYNFLKIIKNMHTCLTMKEKLKFKPANLNCVNNCESIIL